MNYFVQSAVRISPLISQKNVLGINFATASASYRTEKPRNPEIGEKNRQTVEQSYFLPEFWGFSIL